MGRHSRLGQVAGGLGVGSSVLLDINGEIGRVSMSVILVPFRGSPKPESAAGLALASNWQPKGATSATTRFKAVNWMLVNVT